MLVLSRHVGEKIRINDEITIVVIDIRSQKVRIGIEAPEEVRLHREEVYLAIEREKKAAALAAETETQETERPKDESNNDTHLPEMRIEEVGQDGGQTVPVQPMQDADGL